MVFCLAIFLYAYEQNHFTEIPSISMSFTQFIAGMLMQMVINDEVANGMKMMKYSVNHTWKFKYPTTAYLTGLL